MLKADARAGFRRLEHSMRKNIIKLSLVSLFFSSFISASPVFSAESFDGTWSAVVVCADVGDVKGYTWRFPVNVRAGQLLGRFVNPSDPLNSGTLSGKIGQNGNALLSMHGLTGKPVYSLAHVAAHRNFDYTASVQFNGASGTGQRVGQRPCDLSFSKN